LAVAQDTGADVKFLFEKSKRVLGSMFLNEGDEGVENQESRDDESLETAAQKKLEQDHDLEHPRNRSPELGAKLLPERDGFVFDAVGTITVKPGFGLLARESGRGGWRLR
jgi:hypothetical protein